MDERRKRVLEVLYGPFKEWNCVMLRLGGGSSVHQRQEWSIWVKLNDCQMVNIVLVQFA